MGPIKNDYIRVAAAVFTVSPSDVEKNLASIYRVLKASHEASIGFTVFPELSLTGYTCQDLFFSPDLQRKTIQGLQSLVAYSNKIPGYFVIGLPVYLNSRCFNAAAFIGRGKLWGVVPKTNLPDYREFYEPRWFTSGRLLEKNQLLGSDYDFAPISSSLIFTTDDCRLTFGIEICEDLWSPLPPSSLQCLAGANIIACPSASPEVIGKKEYRKTLVKSQSGRCLTGYIYSSAGYGESSAETVYSGHCLIAESGHIIAENQSLTDTVFLQADIDVERLTFLRHRDSTFGQYEISKDVISVSVGKVPMLAKPDRTFSSHPFIPKKSKEVAARCQQIFRIQTTALVKRIEATQSEKIVMGISGGLDSTLALFVGVEAFKILKRPPTDLIGVQLPALGTGDFSHKNAEELLKKLNVSSLTIDLQDLSRSVLDLIHHPKGSHDTTYENVQARARTFILMSLANQKNGIFVGTSDLSEIALGWSTFGGDHLAMYHVNAGVPKTLIKVLLSYLGENVFKEVSEVLQKIILSPISPELIPSDKNGQIQSTEDHLGPYDLHDFFMYHHIRYGADKEKLEMISALAFGEKYSSELRLKTLDTFLRRFRSSQYKRNSMPDSPKIGTVALSPRSDWRMPSDL